MSASDFPFLSSISRHMCIVLFMTASAKSSILVCTRVETAVLFLLFFFHIFFHTQFSYVTIGTIVYIIALQCSSMLHCNSLRTCKPCFESPSTSTTRSKRLRNTPNGWLTVTLWLTVIVCTEPRPIITQSPGYIFILKLYPG